MKGQCPFCRGYFEVQDRFQGEQGKCPFCGRIIVIQGIDTPEAGASPNAGGVYSEDAGRYAGFLERTVALLIDSAILGAVQFALQLLQLNMVYFILALLYEAVFLSRCGATPGKMVMGLKVQHNGQNPTVLRAFCRDLCRAFSLILLCIGYLMALFMPRKQTLHDLICDTVVVKVKS